MSFFQTSSSRPSFFGSSKPIPAPPTATSIPEEQPTGQSGSSRPFSFSMSFGNYFTSPESSGIVGNTMDISSHDDQQTGDRNEEDMHEANDEPQQTRNLFHSSCRASEGHEELGDDQSFDHQDEKESPISRSIEKPNPEPQKRDDGFCVPVGEPKRVKFATPKLLKVPLKLHVSPPNSKHSPKPQINSPEPRCITPEQPIPESVHNHLEACQHEEQQTQLTPISEESEEQVQSQGHPHQIPQEDQRHFHFPNRLDSERKAHSRFMRANPELPLADDSCEVLVEKIINIEKMMDVGTTLYREIDEKIDDSFVDLLDQRYR
jgi:hypothetical protein